jgi:catechol 2,3-dioxygenase-like lactoylglutathione lyase family enzyme
MGFGARTALWTLCTATIWGQTAPAGEVVGVGGFTHIVANVEKSLEFYRDLLGLELIAPVPAFGTTGWISKMGNTGGAQSRAARMRIPGSPLGVELIDYKDIDRQPVHPSLQDPGAAVLLLTVRDIDALIAQVKKADVDVITAGGDARTLNENGSKVRVIFLRDPDGFFVELMQPAALPKTVAPASSNVIGARFGITVSDLEQTMGIYHDLLGFQPHIDAVFKSDKDRMEIAGTEGAQYRAATADIPGTSVGMAFLEFKGIARKPLHTRVPDPGTAILQVGVRDADSITRKLAAAGVTVISEGGAPVDTSNGGRFVIVRDPNNLFLELFRRAPATK